MKDFPWCVAAFFLGGFAGFSVRVIADREKIDSLKDEALRRGCAEWVIKDQTTGETSFSWKEKP